jgi:hypothetical protein
VKIIAAPRSDQWNADDFAGGPRTFTIAAVKPGTAEQLHDIELVEGEGRVWRPPVTMLRILKTAWGDEGNDWVGRKVTLHLDPNVRFGKEVVGGIRISHLSHIPGPLKAAVTVTRGKRAPYVVQPLTEPVKPAVDWDAELQSAGTDMSAIKAIYNRANQLGDTAALAKIKAAGDAILAANKEES